MHQVHSFKVSALVGAVFALLLTGCQSTQQVAHEHSKPDASAPSVVVMENMAMERVAMAPAPRVMAKMAYSVPISEAILTANTEKYANHTPNPIQSVANNPISTFGVDVDTGSYANVRRLLTDGRLPQAGAVRTEEFINYFSYDYPKPKDGKPFLVHTSLVQSPYKQGAKLLKIGIQAKETAKEALPPANLVFLVDVSGSMSDRNKLPLVKQTLRILTEQLRDTDSVSIITYASGEKLVLPATYANKEGKEAILRAINQMQAGGATAGEQAIQLAYNEANKHFKKDGINRILLLTDGDFNVGITDFNALKDMVAQKRKSGISLSTFGYGVGNYNEHLMEQMADAGDGNYSYIDGVNEAKKVLNRQLSSTLETVAKDVKIQVEFNPATVKEYRLIGYENRTLKEEDFKNDNVDSGDIGAGHTVTALYEIVPVGVEGYLADKRYEAPKTKAGNASEYAQVAIRYKAPNSTQSQELKQVLTKANATPLDKADKDTQWAVAVATFAELLQGGQYAGKMTHQDVLNLANTAKGVDNDGTRAEFMELVKIADSLSAKPKP